MRNFQTHRTGILALIVAMAGAPRLAAANPLPDYERAPINYSHTKPQEPIAQLVKRVAAKEVALGGSDVEILRAVLHELHIPPESQVVVFSKTSLQAGLIHPGNPRALYFSDSIYVGWVPGGLIEVASVDPVLGPIFYSFDPQDARDHRRTFVRESACLRCHGGTFGRDIPGLFERSVLTAADGEPLGARDAGDTVDDATPFAQRWAGWYVTGYTGPENHRGNAFATAAHGEAAAKFAPTADRPISLEGKFDTSNYLGATSDVVALLVFQHQLAMHNSLSRAGQRCRWMINYQRAHQGSVGESLSEAPVYEDVRATFAECAQDVVDHLLFRGAAPLPEGIGGDEAFRHAFAGAPDVPRSASGASLKDFSLHGRLFANRCSFLIYSESFRALPAPLKEQIYARLLAALREDGSEGREPEAWQRYAYLEKEEKARILEILRETVPELRERLAGPKRGE